MGGVIALGFIAIACYAFGFAMLHKWIREQEKAERWELRYSAYKKAYMSACEDLDKSTKNFKAWRLAHPFANDSYADLHKRIGAQRRELRRLQRRT